MKSIFNNLCSVPNIEIKKATLFQSSSIDGWLERDHQKGEGETSAPTRGQDWEGFVLGADRPGAVRLRPLEIGSSRV